MLKFWRIFLHEYTRHVLRRRFIVALLSVPLWVLFAFGMGFLSIIMMMNHAPVGYVDQANVIKNNSMPEKYSSPINQVKFQPFSNEKDARSALLAEKIQAYYVLPPDFFEKRAVRIVFLEEPTGLVKSQFEDLMRMNTFSGQPPAVINRLMRGSQLVMEATKERRKVANTDWFKIAAPLAAGFFLIGSIFTSSGYLMQAVVEEKENRTMEILVTSASPGAIMSGKIIALILVGLTQVLVWCIFPLVAVLLVKAYTPYLPDANIEWGFISLIFATILPTFVLFSAFMAAVGASITEASEGQQVSSLVSLLVMAPYMLAAVILANPSGPVALFLSFFPLTASLTILIRMAFATVPTWQTLVSALLLLLSSLAALWLAGRIFRVGMLRYGKRMSWKEILSAARLSGPPQTARKDIASRDSLPEEMVK